MQQDAPDAEHEPQVTMDAPVGLGSDRRRPGRKDDVSLALIPLLRGGPGPDVQPHDKPDLEHGRGDLAATFGIAVSVFLSALLWAGIGAAGDALFR